MTIVRVLPVIALAALAACASDVPGPLTGRYEGTCSSFTPGSPEVEGEPCCYRLDLRQTDRYLHGTTAKTHGTTSSRGHFDGTVNGARITACTWAAGDDGNPCPAAWSAEVTGSGAPGTLLEGRACNNFRTLLCLRFRVVKQ